MHNAPPSRKSNTGGTVGTRRTPIQARAQRTVEAILKAALQVLELHGEKGLVTNRIAERAGFSIGTLYQYFPNKEKLICTLATCGQQMVLKQIKNQLSEIENLPNVKRLDSKEIIKSISKLLIDGFCFGKKSSNENSYAPTLIRLAWTLEQTQQTISLTNEVTTRLNIFIETIRHPDLPPLSIGQYFVLVRSILGTLRYASLEKQSLLTRDNLEDVLNTMTQHYFQLAKVPANDGIRPQECAAFMPYIETAKSSNGMLHDDHNSAFLRRAPVQGRAKYTVVTIFKAALQMLGQEGDDGLTAQKIAKRSGFSIGTFYQYFSNKDTLVRMMASHGQNLIFHQFDKSLTRMEKYPNIAEVDAKLLVNEIISIYVNGISQGKLLPESKYVGQLLIKLCWTLENVTDTIQMAERVTNRIKQAITKIEHPALPTPDAMTLFVVSRSLLGTLRSASLEESPLLASPSLESSLTQMAIALLVRNQE